jgi:hypothetical protein
MIVDGSSNVSPLPVISPSHIMLKDPDPSSWSFSIETATEEPGLSPLESKKVGSIGCRVGFGYDAMWLAALSFSQLPAKDGVTETCSKCKKGHVSTCP